MEKPDLVLPPDDVIRESLDTLQREIERAASRYGPLFHDQIIPPYLLEDGDDADLRWKNEFEAFCTANSPSSDGQWQEWHCPRPRRDALDWFGRFYGAKDGLTEFRYLAESLYLLMRKIDSDLPDDGGYEGCLNTLHTVAACWPTTFLRSKESMWGYPSGDGGGHSFSEATRDGVVYYDQPTVETIQGNVFIAAAQFCKMIAHDSRTLFFSDFHWTEPDYPVLPEDDQDEDETAPRDGDDTVATPSISELAVKGSSLTFEKGLPCHVVFRYGTQSNEVEEGWLDDGAGVQYLAYILERPHEAISFSQVPSVMSKGRTLRGISAAEAIDSDGHLMSGATSRQPADIEHKRQYFDTLNKLRAEIDAADNEVEKEELQEQFESIRRSYNEDYDKLGRSRIFTNRIEGQHRARVANAIDRLKDKYLNAPEAERKLPFFWEEVARIRYRDTPVIEYSPSLGVGWSMKRNK